MKAIVVTPKNSNELICVTDLPEKSGAGSSTLDQEEPEDMGMYGLMRRIDKTKQVSRTEIMKKLSGR